MTALFDPDIRTLVDELIEEQQRLTAVERFAHLHDRGALPAMAGRYRALIPSRDPGEGEQYAFSVDLDACTGCKACVTACHSLNGLDGDETWRNVGLLHGGTRDDPFQQTVTTACHHCVDPACLNGCPVLAYDKDTRTGIVRHLDDQCIGCQYCILKCPYDVPKYHPAKGIVRKCDMCSNRLAVGEAPACVQGCPNEAIRITVISKAELVERAKQGKFLPGSPDPQYTRPTTTYHTRREFPANTASADSERLHPEHTHPALVIMLTLTQLSAGAYCVQTLLRCAFPRNLIVALAPGHSLIALILGMIALGASTLHLGRPLYAWRAVIGLRTSWLSREILAFGGFATMAMLDALACCFLPVRTVTLVTGAAVSVSGLAGVFCSLMIYHDTRRKLWGGPATALKFFGTAAVLGSATILFVTTAQATVAGAVARQGAYAELTYTVAVALVVSTVLKLAVEAAIFRHLHYPSQPLLRRSALLMSGELAELTTARFVMGILGGVLLPLVFIFQKPAAGFATLGITFWIAAFAVIGEGLERHLFFAAVVPPKMPGGAMP